MGDTVIVIIVIALSVVLMFVFPLMTMADRTDDIAQLTIETATSDFVNSIVVKGKITPEDYQSFLQTITSTGNTYDVEIEVQVLDENPGKKTTQTDRTTIGENEYYIITTSQVLDVIDPDGGTPKSYGLKEGDFVFVRTKNTNQTLAQQLKNFFYTVVGNDTYSQSTEKGAMVKATGK